MLDGLKEQERVAQGQHAALAKSLKSQQAALGEETTRLAAMRAERETIRNGLVQLQRQAADHALRAEEKMRPMNAAVQQIERAIKEKEEARKRHTN